MSYIPGCNGGSSVSVLDLVSYWRSHRKGRGANAISRFRLACRM